MSLSEAKSEESKIKNGTSEARKTNIFIIQSVAFVKRENGLNRKAV